MTQENPAHSSAPKIVSLSTRRKPKSETDRFGVVTFLDVLGWKGIYNRENSPLRRLKQLVELIEARARGVSSSPRVIAMSDTIAVFSDLTDRSEDSHSLHGTLELHGRLCSAAIAHSIANAIPVRGATSVGSYRMDADMFVGKAIDEVAAWYEQTDWIGVHMTPSAFLRINLDDDPISHWRKHSPPLKKNRYGETAVVSWWEDWKLEAPNQPFRWLREHFLQMAPILPDFSDKIGNTIAFAEKMA